MSALTYGSAGVDLDTAAAVSKLVAPALARAQRREVRSMPGGFCGGFELDLAGRRAPVLVGATDGVGTKVMLAAAHGRYEGIGIDLVAMCVNDLLTCGAEPLFFLDYVASGRIERTALQQIVASVAHGCERSGCALIGGETAEMPGMYGQGHFDLAGCAVGVVERDEQVDPAAARPGDIVLGLAASGLHANGFSLVRAALERTGVDHAVGGRQLVDELLEPTRIYAREVAMLMQAVDVVALAHVTGGGLAENLQRVLAPTIDAHIDQRSWSLPPVYGYLRDEAGITDAELRRVFNCGVGFVCIVRPQDASAAMAAVTECGCDAFPIGQLARGTGRVVLT